MDEIAAYCDLRFEAMQNESGGNELLSLATGSVASGRVVHVPLLNRYV